MSYCGCEQCGDMTLVYEKLSGTTVDVAIDPDGHIQEPCWQFDEDEEICDGRFVCKYCHHPLLLDGSNIETEEQLISYIRIKDERVQKGLEELFADIPDIEQVDSDKLSPANDLGSRHSMR